MKPRGKSLIFAVSRFVAAITVVSPILTRAGEATAASSSTVQSPAVVTGQAQILDDLEGHKPKDWQDRKQIVETNTAVVGLVETNTLETGSDFYRAATLVQYDLQEFRLGRVRYELLLTAAAKDHPAAQKELPQAWDNLLRLLGRPMRIDPFGVVERNPNSFELDAAPACISIVLRDPNGARTTLVGAKENPEIKTIKDADQADRKINWTTLTDEDRKALMARDHQRNARMREIVRGGELHTASDYANASLVLQHSANFSGFQLAHELAVCSMVLGDRRLGRWLVTATYDRMLRTLGHDQRFGTQMGPDGPLRVDETGICDAERQALGCPTLEVARTRRASGSRVISKAVGG